MLLSPFISTVVLLSSLARAYSFPGTCSGDCVVSDPSTIRRADGTYFRFSTNHKIVVSKAKSLSGPWKNVGAALPRGSKINLAGREDLWVCHI